MYCILFLQVSWQTHVPKIDSEPIVYINFAKSNISFVVDAAVVFLFFFFLFFSTLYSSKHCWRRNYKIITLLNYHNFCLPEKFMKTFDAFKLPSYFIALRGRRKMTVILRTLNNPLLKKQTSRFFIFRFYRILRTDQLINKLAQAF